jgi:Uma2 family endonuclease
MGAFYDKIGGMATQMERPRLRLTQAHVKLMLDANLITPHDYELIDGDLVEKMPQNQPHAVTVRRVTRLMEAVFGFDFIGTASPIFIDEGNAPEPDIFATHDPLSSYAENPAAQECLLAVEVSDSTLSYDRSTKAELYARAGILEYWIVNLNARTLIVHRAPTDEGYGELRTLTEIDSVTPLGQSSSVAVADLF